MFWSWSLQALMMVWTRVKMGILMWRREQFVTSWQWKFELPEKVSARVSNVPSSSQTIAAAYNRNNRDLNRRRGSDCVLHSDWTPIWRILQ